MTTKAELNALLSVPFTPSQLKKKTHAELVAMLPEIVATDAEVAASLTPEEAARLDRLADAIDREFAGDDTPPTDAKPTAHRHQPRTITVEPRGEVKPFKAGTIQAQVADVLRSGATIGDLRRVCIRKDGTVWKDSAIRGLFSTDMRAHGFGVRTELWNGFQLWRNSSFDDATSFTPAMMALENGHPDDNRDHDANLTDAIANHGFDPEELHQVFFLVEPKGLRRAMSAAVIPLRPGDGSRRPSPLRTIARGMRIARGSVEAFGWIMLLGLVLATYR